MTDGDTALDAQLETLAGRARERLGRIWTRTFAITLVVLGVVVFVAIVGNSKHVNVPAALAGTGVAIVLVGLFAWLGRRRFAGWQRDDLLTAGLDRAQRKQVARDIRAGTPNSDPLLREVERRQVSRMIKHDRYSKWVFPLAAALELLNAALRDTTWVRILFVVLAVAMLALWPVQHAQVRRARRFPV